MNENGGQNRDTQSKKKKNVLIIKRESINRSRSPANSLVQISTIDAYNFGSPKSGDIIKLKNGMMSEY